MRIINSSLLCWLLLLPLLAGAQRNTVSLNGAWTFALDPQHTGVQNGWGAASFPDKSLDKVTVPHCYSVDKRYFFHTGTAWYFKAFNAAPLQKGTRAFIRFDAVFYKTNIWLNGKLMGSHEGGYTPFEIDVTDQLLQKNMLSVQVNNEWDTTTIPGAKTVDATYRGNASQLYAWMNYGGIIKPVHFIIRPDTYISRIKINAVPDLQKGTATVQIKAVINQAAAPAARAVVQANIYNLATGEKYKTVFKMGGTVPDLAGEVSMLLETNLPAKDVRLWSYDNPALYRAEVYIANDTVSKNFGIRKVEVKGAQILLNGKPLKIGGANRPTDYPGMGSLDPDSILVKDLTLMKNGGMEFSRIGHHAVSENILDWADKNGMLIITEAGNWQMTPKQMADAAMRKNYQSQLKEMVERDWNHPSVVAYSLGNEFYSQTQEGKDWVKDMSAYIKTIDATRLITFASYIVWRDYVKKPEDEASQYVDFISANIYGKHLACLQHIHELYPDKPVYISEFGIRATPNKTEQDRINYLVSAMEAIRQCDYVTGASVWTFNDYSSRYPETDADGYRAWGLVTPQREPRGMYYKWQEEFSPATIALLKRENGKAVFRVTVRKDFPSYTLEGYQFSWNGKPVALRTLAPGESEEITVTTGTEKINVALLKPGGFTILNKIY
jgi:beta-glucuronidase